MEHLSVSISLSALAIYLPSHMEDSVPGQWVHRQGPNNKKSSTRGGLMSQKEEGSVSHQAPVWSEVKAATPTGSWEVHSRIKPWSLRSGTPAPPWKNCTVPSWSRQPYEKDRGWGRSTPRRTRRREMSFYRPAPSEPSAPTQKERKQGKVSTRRRSTDSSPEIWIMTVMWRTSSSSVCQYVIINHLIYSACKM